MVKFKIFEISYLIIILFFFKKNFLDGFIMTEEDLESVTNGLMAELFPMLEALNSIETRIKGPKTLNYPQN